MSTKIKFVPCVACRGYILCVALLCSIFSWHTSSAQTVPSSAHDPSRELSSLGDVGQGVHVGESFLFVIVELPWVGNTRRLEASAELRSNTLLRDYLTIEQLENEQRQQLFRLLLKNTDATFPSLPRLSIGVQILESGPKGSDSDVYRRVVAIPLSAVSEAGHSRAAALSAYNEVIKHFLHRWQHYPDALEQIGFKSLSLIAERYVLGKQVSIVNVVAPDDAPIQTRARYGEFLAEKDFRPESLEQWPGELAITSKQTEKYGYQSRRGLAWASISCLHPRSNFSEYVEDFVGLNVPEGSATPADNGVIFQSVVQCRGFVTFHDVFSSDQPAVFADLQRLFSAGEDLPAALSLALEIVEKSPGFPQGWGYLSAAFKADGDLALARIASLARLSLEPTSAAAVRQYLRLVEPGKSEIMRQFVRDAMAHLGTE